MTAAELESIASRVFGHGWQIKLAAYLEVSDRTVRRWVAGQPIPEGAAQQILDLVRIKPPSNGLSENDRDQACRVALYPHLHDLANRAIHTGWEPAEVLAATLAWMTQQTIDIAGSKVAKEMLDDALAEISADEQGRR